MMKGISSKKGVCLFVCPSLAEILFSLDVFVLLYVKRVSNNKGRFYSILYNIYIRGIGDI